MRPSRPEARMTRAPSIEGSANWNLSRKNGVDTKKMKEEIPAPIIHFCDGLVFLSILKRWSCFERLTTMREILPSTRLPNAIVVAITWE